MMTNYDKWLQKRRQELETQLKELDGMTPLLAAVAIDEHDTKNDRCSLSEDSDKSEYLCDIEPRQGCICCIKQWLSQDAVE